MSLFIRLQCSFFEHRKTKRLKAAIGNDALWLLPRLWTYAAEYHPDGLLPRYDAAELAECLGYTGDAETMLKALLDIGWLDSNPLRVHDWDEYNAYHQAFSTRAKKAADARWQKERTKEKDIDKRRDGEEQAMRSICSSNAQAMLKHNPLISKADAIAQAALSGAAEDFAAFVYDDWSSRSGKDGSECKVEWAPYIAKRWNRERTEWMNGTHQGKRTNANHSRPNRQSTDRNKGTHNEGRAHLYANAYANHPKK
jgi:hypothetical protein